MTTMDRSLSRSALCLAASLLALAAAGCGARRLVPLDGVAAGDPHRPLVQKVAGALTLSVQPQAWAGRPEGFEGTFLPLRIIVRNTSPEEVTLRAQDQVLHDDRGNRWRAVPPEEAGRQFAEHIDTIRRPTASVGATGPAPTTWRLGLGLRRERPPDLTEVLRLAFPEDPIPPDASREGFFYFPLPPDDWRRLQLTLAWSGGGFPLGHTTFEFAAR